MLRFSSLFFLTFFTVSVVFAWESDNTTAPSPKIDIQKKTHSEKKSAEKNWNSALDTPHNFVSRRLEHTIRKIDNFFAADTAFEDYNQSYFQFSSNVIIEEGGNLSFSGKIRLKLELPKTENRLKLLFESDPNELQSKEGLESDTSLSDSVENKRYFASIESEVDIERWTLRPSIGVKSGSSFDLFSRIRFTKKLALKSWWLRFNENIYWFNSEGTGTDTTVEFDREIQRNLMFRYQTFVNWSSKNQHIKLRKVFSLTYKLRKPTILSYEINIFGDDANGKKINRHLMLFRFRDNSYKDWIFIEVRPQIEYLKINNWHADYSLFINLDVVFGGKFL